MVSDSTREFLWSLGTSMVVLTVALFLGVGSEHFNLGGVPDSEFNTSSTTSTSQSPIKKVNATTPLGHVAEALSSELHGMVILMGAGGKTLAQELQLRHGTLHVIVADSQELIGDFNVDSNKRLTYIPANIYEHVPEGASFYAAVGALEHVKDDKAVQLLTTVRRSAANALQAPHLYIVEELRSGRAEARLGARANKQGTLRSKEEFANLLTKSGWKLVKGTTTQSALHILKAVRNGGSE